MTAAWGLGSRNPAIGPARRRIIARGDELIHLFARKREAGADRQKPRARAGIVIIGEADAQYLPGRIVARIAHDGTAPTAAHLAQLFDDVVHRVLDGNQGLEVVGAYLRTGGAADNLPHPTDRALLRPGRVRCRFT